MKNAADASDIEYMILWLFRNNLKIRFEDYAGMTKDELIPLVRVISADSKFWMCNVILVSVCKVPQAPIHVRRQFLCNLVLSVHDRWLWLWTYGW